MLIVLLAVLGVDLLGIVVIVGAVLSRRRWVSHQPGAFKGAIRVVRGDVPGLGPKWRHGYGRWVRDVLVWTKGPLLFRNKVVGADGLAGRERSAEPGEVRRLGQQPTVVSVAVDEDTVIEIAVPEEALDKARGSFAVPDVQGAR
jgi:hypothetical protein